MSWLTQICCAANGIVENLRREPFNEQNFLFKNILREMSKAEWKSQGHIQQSKVWRQYSAFQMISFSSYSKYTNAWPGQLKHRFSMCLSWSRHAPKHHKSGMPCRGQQSVTWRPGRGPAVKWGVWAPVSSIWKAMSSHWSNGYPSSPNR